jgi:hypothetical protein
MNGEKGSCGKIINEVENTRGCTPARIAQVLKTLTDHVRVMRMSITRVRKSKGFKYLIGKFESQSLSGLMRLWCSPRSKLAFGNGCAIAGSRM